MRLEKLKDLYNQSRTNPHYHYRDLTEAEFLAKAELSFKKLPDAQKKKVAKSWGEKLDKEQIVLPPQEGLETMLKYRFLAQTNLFFLCHLLESYNATTVNTHEEIANSFFVQKDPTFITFDHFADNYTDLKQRMLLVPVEVLSRV